MNYLVLPDLVPTTATLITPNTSLIQFDAPLTSGVQYTLEVFDIFSDPPIPNGPPFDTAEFIAGVINPDLAADTNVATDGTQVFEGVYVTVRGTVLENIVIEDTVSVVGSRGIRVRDTAMTPTLPFSVGFESQAVFAGAVTGLTGMAILADFEPLFVDEGTGTIPPPTVIDITVIQNVGGTPFEGEDFESSYVQVQGLEFVSRVDEDRITTDTLGPVFIGDQRYLVRTRPGGPVDGVVYIPIFSDIPGNFIPDPINEVVDISGVLIQEDPTAPFDGRYTLAIFQFADIEVTDVTSINDWMLY